MIQFSLDARAMVADFQKVIAEAEIEAREQTRDANRRIAEVAAANAPVGTETRPGEPHLRDTIEADQVGENEWVVTVSSDHWLYVEFGTSKMAAEPYIRPAIAQVAGA